MIHLQHAINHANRAYESENFMTLQLASKIYSLRGKKKTNVKPEKKVRNFAFHLTGRRMEIIQIDRLSNKDVLYRVEEKRNVLHTVKRRKAIWIDHILYRDCFLKNIIEGNIERRIEVMGRQERRRKHLLRGFKETKGYRKFEKGSTRSHFLQNQLWNRTLLQ